MFKKALLVLFLLLSSLFSDVSLGVIGNHAYVEFDTIEEFSTDQGKNWVAIYKKGDSTDWDNVLRWAWITDLPSHGEKTYDFKFDDLDSEGLYELRFFYDNSYDIAKSVVFEFTSGSSSFIQIISHDSNTLKLISSNIDLNTNSWIGIFEKGKSNDWDNVIGWSWVDSVTSNDKDYKSTIKDLTLADGVYDIRLFYNNSFEEEASVELVVDSGNGDVSIKFVTTQYYFLKIYASGVIDDQAWIGLYEKEKSNDWANVIIWSWNSPGKEFYIQDIRELLTLDKEYELRLFYNNSFNLEKAIPYIGPGAVAPQIIKARFSDVNPTPTLYIQFTQWFSKNMKSFVGVYKQGDETIEENLIISRVNAQASSGLGYSKSVRFTDLSKFNKNGKYRVVFGIDQNKFLNKSEGYETIIHDGVIYNIVSTSNFEGNYVVEL